MPMSPTRYLALLGASFLLVFGAVWAYAALFGMAFYESGYPSWKAKEQMLAACRLGDAAFYGDSRLESAVVPALLPVPASNLGLPAGTALEVREAVRRTLRCPAAPAQAVISLTPAHFGPVSRFFWLLSVRYGFIPPAEVFALADWADRLGDTRTFDTPTPEGFGGRLRDALYALRFPSLSFNSLVQGRLFGRYRTNTERLAAVLESRGWSDYGADGGLVGELDAPFSPTKLQEAAFEDTLRRLTERGTEVVLLPLPFSQSGLTRPESRAAYMAFLAAAAARIRGVHLATSDAPVWPDNMFVDGEHLTGAAARLFTTRLAACWTEGRLRAPCDLHWRAETASQ